MFDLPKLKDKLFLKKIQTIQLNLDQIHFFKISRNLFLYQK